ncbi:MAG: GtrA family protein [Clostridia bacterium]|nr:GtrA family protein [Clostridia bacterium]
MKKIFCKVVDFFENLFLKLLRLVRLNSLAEWYIKHKEGMRYLIFGFLATVVNIFTFWLCETLWDFSTTVNNIIAWVTAVIFAYLSNKWCVFESKSNTSKELFIEFISFIGARVFTLVLETILLNITIDYLKFNSLLMKIISNIMVIILNFVFSKLFIFRKEKNKDKKTN